MTISFDELDLLMQQKSGEEKPQEPTYARGDFLDYMKQLTSNSAGYTGDAHAPSNTDLKPLNGFEMSRAAAPEFDLDQHYSQVHDMDLALGKGGQLPTSFDVGVRPQYELDKYV